MDKRECDGCTKCCEGWLAGEVHGHNMFKGRPCFYFNKNCTIYEDRPDHPCKSFKCSWLSEEKVFPVWMKPDSINAIITRQKFNDIFYYEVTETGVTLEARTLSWLIQWAISTETNLLYRIDGGLNRIGSTEFLSLNLM